MDMSPEIPQEYQPQIPQATGKEVPCPKCGKLFQGEIGLRVHTARTHEGRSWSNEKAVKAAAAAKKAKKEASEVNGVTKRKHRPTDFEAENLERPANWNKMTAGQKSSWVRMHRYTKEERAAMTKKANIARWKGVSPQQRSKMAAAISKKRWQKEKESPVLVEEATTPTPQPTTTLRYCPCCGLNLDVLITALNAVAGVNHGRQ